MIVPINVPADDPLDHIVNTSMNTNETESFLPKEKDDVSLLSKLNSLDLSTLNLDDLLLLLYRLQQQTTRIANTKNSVTASASTSSSSSSSSSSGFTGLYLSQCIYHLLYFIFKNVNLRFKSPHQYQLFIR